MASYNFPTSPGTGTHIDEDEFSPHKPRPQSVSYDLGSQSMSQQGDFETMSRRGTVGATQQRMYSGPVCRRDIQRWKGANPWSVSCCFSVWYHPLYCLSAQVCFPCRIYQQRKSLLLYRDEDYQCCAGICGKQNTDPCRSYFRGNESLCLGCEVVLCPCWAMYGNRWMVMQHYNLENDLVDKAANAFTCPLSVLSYFWQDDVIENLVYAPCPLCAGCIMAQHQHHMDMYGYPVGQNVTIRRDMR
jgi:hypothetical protein